jgi:hypothetical protein
MKVEWNVAWMEMIMKSIQHLSEDERRHFMFCPCGSYFDMRDLAQVFAHLHDARLPQPQWSYSVRKGEAQAHTPDGGRLDLN